MSAPTLHTKKPEHLLQQASGVIPTPEKETKMSTIISQSEETAKCSDADAVTRVVSDVAMRVRQALVEAGHDLNTAAERLDLDESMLSGAEPYTIAQLVRVAKITGKTLDDLIPDDLDEQVKLPEVVAPHIAAWNRLAEATDRVVDAEKPHPRNEGKFIPWCVECVDARDGERPAHPIEQGSVVHRSDRANLILDLGSPELHGGWAALPTIEVSVIRYLKNRSENSKGHRIQLEYRHGIDGGKVIPAMTIPVAREFISMLQAAIDLATGRDDFEDQA